MGVPWNDLPQGSAGFLKNGREWIAGETARLRLDNASVLTFNTRMIEDFKDVPRHQVAQGFLKSVGEWDKKHEVRILWVIQWSFPERDLESQTHLFCAISALAAERFRLRKSRWPNSLDELVKTGLLREIPIDLMDGKSLRFRRTIDGLVIHSIGRDGKYRGDALNDLWDFDCNKERTEFRLWDVEHRVQASAKR